MASVTLSATPKGNGFQATVSYDGWVSISSAETYPTMAEAISALDRDIYGAAMQAQQVDPIVMEFCNFLYAMGGSYYNEEMTEPAINNETGVKAAELYARCVNNAAQPGAAGADLNDTMATYSQGRAFSMISYMFMLSVFNELEVEHMRRRAGAGARPGCGARRWRRWPAWGWPGTRGSNRAATSACRRAFLKTWRAC